MTIALKIENVSKMYRLGTVGTGTLSHDLNRWWATLRGKPDPALMIGATNDRTESGGEHVWALKDINLEVEQGEILGIIGRNGAGKSTLLKLLSRVTAPTTGSIKSRGRIASLLEVGTGFHPELTGRENVYLNGAIMGMTRHEVAKRLDEIVEFSGCAKYIDTPVKRYSSGMTVRLGFAVAAHLECEILVVDEVLAVGDSEFQKKCIGKMQQVGASGRTILFVSHNMASIQKLCRKCVVIENGEASEALLPADAVEAYFSKNSFIAETRGSLIHSVQAETAGRASNCFMPDEPVALRISLKLSGRILHAPRLGIGFDDCFGNRLTTVGTYFSVGDVPENITGHWDVTCHLGALPLAPGAYRIKIALGEGQSDVEVFENALEIQWAATDFYGTGHLPVRGQGPLLTKTEWQFEKK